MFGFLKAKAPVELVAADLWKPVARDAAVIAQASEGRGYEESVFYVAFATDVAIYKATQKEPDKCRALRDAFLSHVQQFAAEHGHMPPVLSQRFKLYGESFSQGWKEGNFPPALELAGLMGSRDAAVLWAAAEMYTATLLATENLFKRIRLA